jgi:hypothetical protein
MLTRIRIDNRINGFLGRPGGTGQRPAAILIIASRYLCVRSAGQLQEGSGAG